MDNFATLEMRKGESAICPNACDRLTYMRQALVGKPAIKRIKWAQENNFKRRCGLHF